MRKQLKKAIFAAPLMAVLALSACSSDKAADTTVAAETTASADTTAAAAETTAAATETTAAATDTTAAAAETTEAAAPATDVNLKGVCPDVVVIQTDWNPEAEHGFLYEMMGANPEINADKKLVTAPLMSGGVDTGVSDERTDAEQGIGLAGNEQRVCRRRGAVAAAGERLAELARRFQHAGGSPATITLDRDDVAVGGADRAGESLLDDAAIGVVGQ